MTVSNATNRVTFAGDDATTSFDTTPIKFFATSDLLVYVTTDATGATEQLTEGTDYTVSGGDESVGAVGAVSLAGGSAPHGALASGTTLVLIREVALLQEADFVQNDASNANVAEAAIDKITMALQRFNDRLDRSLVISDGDVSGADFTVPTPVASQVIGWNSLGTALQLYSAADIDAALVSVFMATVLDDATAGDALTTLGVSAFVQTLLDDANAATARGTLGFSAIAAKGDMWYGSAADTPATLTSGLEMWMPTSGRLTLTTAVPVTSSDVTAATTVYFTPYKGNVIQLFDGTVWVPTVFAELSQATTDATKSPAAVAADSNYDVFVWNDAGTLRATRGPAWSSATARGTGAGTTELEMLEGRYVNKIAITNGPAAQRGLYVGTIRSTSASQIEDSLAKRYVWNNFNRVPRNMQARDATNSWAYSTGSFRQANGSTANQLDFVRGLDEDAVTAHLSAGGSGSDATLRTVYGGIGLDSTTTHAGLIGVAGFHSAAQAGVSAYYSGLPGLGRHFLAWLEWGNPAHTTTWQGDGGGTTQIHGIQGVMPA